MICPRCKIQLTNKRISDLKFSIDVDYCETCNGTWFDKGELVKLENTIEPTLIEFRKIPSKKDQNVALSCPLCGNLQLLQKVGHPKDKRVVIDYCPVCKGIWLDKGELDAIQKENWLITIGRLFKWLFSNN